MYDAIADYGVILVTCMNLIKTYLHSNIFFEYFEIFFCENDRNNWLNTINGKNYVKTCWISKISQFRNQRYETILQHH